jgi:transposase
MASTRLTEEEKANIAKLYLEGHSISKIAGLTGRSSFSVKKVIRKDWVNRK